ncbi:MAG: hypothetical protein ACTS73_09965 [Arsenophonus sp. NEOnobi-MAG3]
MPKANGDRSGNGICFNSLLLPRYLNRPKSLKELLPWLYLQCISSIGDFYEAFVVSFSLKQKWLEEKRQWCLHDLSDTRYVYFLLDGIYTPVKQDDPLCPAGVIIGITDAWTRKER